MKITDDIKKLVVKMNAVGITQKDIATFTNLSPRSVSTILKNAVTEPSEINLLNKLINQITILKDQVAHLQKQVNLLIKSRPESVLNSQFTNTQLTNTPLSNSKLPDKIIKPNKELIDIATSSSNRLNF